MNDNQDFTPTLTLNPTLDSSAPAAPAAPTPAPQEAMAEIQLSPQEQQMVEDFAQKIDLTDTAMVLQYGAAAQKNIADFSENALNNVRTKDLGQVGQALSSLVVELKNFGQQPEKKGIAGFFQKKKNDLEAMKASYSKAETNVDKIVKVLENHQVVLMKDIAMFDQM